MTFLTARRAVLGMRKMLLLLLVLFLFFNFSLSLDFFRLWQAVIGRLVVQDVMSAMMDNFRHQVRDFKSGREPPIPRS